MAQLTDKQRQTLAGIVEKLGQESGRYAEVPALVQPAKELAHVLARLPPECPEAVAVSTALMSLIDALGSPTATAFRQEAASHAARAVQAALSP